MKINAAAGYEQYKSYVKGLKNSDSATGKIKNESGRPTAANTDKVTFSEAAAAQAEVSRLATALTGEVEELGSAQHLAQLEESLANGRYFVDSEAIVSSILGEA